MFIVYSFLETSSLLLHNEHDEIQIDSKNIIIYKMVNTLMISQ